MKQRKSLVILAALEAGLELKFKDSGHIITMHERQIVVVAHYADSKQKVYLPFDISLTDFVYWCDRMKEDDEALVKAVRYLNKKGTPP